MTIEGVPKGNLEEQVFDAIVVGTGMGGATCGLALAKAGWRVLFCERGASAREQDVAGHYVELEFSHQAIASELDAPLLRRAGRRAVPLVERRGAHGIRFVPFVGEGAGGSTALYGMVLERFGPQDFAGGRGLDPAEKDANPQAWPVTFEEFEPFYQRAEALYGVTTSGEGGFQEGSASEDMAEYLAEKGLACYRLPLACARGPACHACQGYRCPYGQKLDASRVALEPAVKEYGAVALFDCAVSRVETEGRQVTSVVAQWGERAIRLRAHIVVLAAGALSTPALLLASGIANSSGQIGRNLMRHLVDLLLFSPDRGMIPVPVTKDLGARGLATQADGVVGSFQSFGPLPPPEVMTDALILDVEQRFGRLIAVPLRAGRNLILRVMRQLVRRNAAFALILEDVPRLENRLTLTADGMEVHYALSAASRARLARARRQLKKVFKRRSTLLIKDAENNQRLAHACGTCRFGTDPTSSVLDRFNRAHDLDNLYVVDASFFPSSGSTNPALTIAANALRVAEHLITTIRLADNKP